MTVDPSVAGRSYPPKPAYEVGREKIREFATATGDSTPATFDVAAARALGYPDLVAPPMFACVLTIGTWVEVVVDDLGVPMVDVLHVDQKYSIKRPIFAGESVITQTFLDEVRTRMGMSLLGLRTELTTDDGESLASAFATLMVRSPE